MFQRCVVVQEVFPEGLVSQDGRLKPGDQLIEINGIDMTNASHHQVSRNSLLRPGGFVPLLITVFTVDV